MLVKNAHRSIFRIFCTKNGRKNSKYSRPKYTRIRVYFFSPRAHTYSSLGTCNIISHWKEHVPRNISVSLLAILVEFMGSQVHGKYLGWTMLPQPISLPHSAPTPGIIDLSNTKNLWRHEFFFIFFNQGIYNEVQIPSFRLRYDSSPFQGV